MDVLSERVLVIDSLRPLRSKLCSLAQERFLSNVRAPKRNAYRRRLGNERLEDRCLLAGVITQLGYFDTWDGGVVPSTDVAGVAFHAPSGHLYLADSEINELPEFQGDNLFEVSLAGDQLYQTIASNNTEPTGITYNELDGFFYVTNDDRHSITRYDNNLNSPLATTSTLLAVPTADDPEGITSDPSGFLYVADGKSGGIQVLVYDADLAFQYSFSVADHAQDAEGIAFSPDNNHLFIVSNAGKALFEFALNGALVEQYNLKGLAPAPKSPQGLTFAPTSDPFDDPSVLALYIADLGVDNVPDGGIYETLVSGGELAQNTAPLVYTGGNRTIPLASFPANIDLNAAVADDSLPNPGTLSTLWSQVSGPAVTFADAAAIDTTATFPLAGTYVLRLTADDGELTTSNDTTIVVQQRVEVAVAASTDDAEERTASGVMRLSTNDLDMTLDSGSATHHEQIVGLRFDGIEIPQGSLIANAYIQFTADETDAIATSLTIEGEGIDNAATFSTTNGDISSRSRTTSSVVWSPAPWTAGDAGVDQRTPNIASIIQEIVARPGWTGGNALALIVSGTGERVAKSYDANPTLVPILHIDVDNEPAPQVTNVLVNNANWSPAYRARIPGADPDGYLIPHGADQTQTLLWGNIREVIVEFSEEVKGSGPDGTLVPADFELSGINNGVATILSPVDYDPLTNRAKLTAAGNLRNDRYLLKVDATKVSDLAGYALDGEFAPNQLGSSGDGVAGGSFWFDFNVMPGDFNRNGNNVVAPSVAVDSSDLSLLGGSWMQTHLDPFYKWNTDANGDLRNDSSDLSVLGLNWIQSLPTPAAGPLAAAGALAPAAALLPAAENAGAAEAALDGVFVMLEMRSSVKHHGLSISRPVADQIFADDDDRRRVLPERNQRNVTADYGGYMMAYECRLSAGQCYLIDNVYDQLGNSFTEFDGLHRNELSGTPD